MLNIRQCYVIFEKEAFISVSMNLARWKLYIEKKNIHRYVINNLYY